MIDRAKRITEFVEDRLYVFLNEGPIDKKYLTARLLLHIFYFIQFTVAYQAFTFNSQLPNWIELVESENMFIPLWPVQWVSLLNYELASKIILIGFLVTSFLGMLFWAKSQFIRVLSFLGILFYLAFISSFGKIDHYLHLMLVANLFLIFLPKTCNSTIDKPYFLKVFWFIQLFILITYSISGFFKFFGIADQLVRGQTSALSPTALGQNVAKSLFHTNRPTFFSEYILNEPGYFLSFVLICGFLIEVAAVFFAFLPRFHRIIGALLIMLHLGIVLTVGADFLYQILVVGIFFLNSPFAIRS